MCKESGLTVAQLMMKNELTWRDEAEVNGGLDRIWQVMQDCVARGCGINYPEADGELPGPLRVRRRAPELYRNLTQRAERTLSDPLSVMDWVNLYAMAVNEENAAGGRGHGADQRRGRHHSGRAALLRPLHPRLEPRGRARLPADRRGGGPAVQVQRLAVRRRSRLPGRGRRGLFHGGGRFAAALGGTVEQVENAAEIGMEHNLGLTCDPVGGLVQIPCIERNAMASVRRSTPPAWRCVATVSTTCRWTRSSRPCARPEPT